MSWFKFLTQPMIAPVVSHNYQFELNRREKQARNLLNRSLSTKPTGRDYWRWEFRLSLGKEFQLSGCRADAAGNGRFWCRTIGGSTRRVWSSGTCTTVKYVLWRGRLCLRCSKLNSERRKERKEFRKTERFWVRASGKCTIEVCTWKL